MSGLSTFQFVAIALLPLLFAITVHEVAHGWVAKQLGDPTAHRLGRLTLNPLKHIDPLGTVLIPLVLVVTTGFAFGWAKPVPVTFENLRHPKRDMAIVAAAGPAANLLMAVLWAIVAVVGQALVGQSAWLGMPLAYMGIIGVSINVALMVLNLIPLPPLDGGRVAVGLLPGPLAWQLSRLEPYGFFILLGLMVFGSIVGVDVFGFIIRPISNGIAMTILSLAGLV